MKPVMEVEHLNKIFFQEGNTDLRAVEDVSFSLYQGECLGIVGESGSGKSTIARLITGLLPPTSGMIRINEAQIHDVKGKALKSLYGKIQMVFQNPAASFDPRKTLGYSIGESLQNRGVSAGERKQKVCSLLEQCGLSGDFFVRYPHEVSGGQCQRAAIARALAVDPDILICDEATSALDVTVQKQILELLEKLKAEKKLSVVFICHNLALVHQLCDRVIVLYNGSIIEQGTPDDILFSPSTEYTKELIAAAFI